MSSFLTPHNGPSLTGVIDVTARSISLFQENAPPKNIEDTFIPQSGISIALPYGVVIDELGNNVTTMYQFTGDINDEKVAGLESLLNYMNENFFTKDDPAINEHNYNITKKRYNEETNNIYNIDNSRTFNIKNNRFLNEQYFHKEQNINDEKVLNVKKNYP